MQKFLSGKFSKKSGLIKLNEETKFVKIGFYLESALGSLDIETKSQVVGEQIIAQKFCNELIKKPKVESAKCFGLNLKPKQPLDFVIYMNMTKPNSDFAKKHICYIQNGFDYGSVKKLCETLRKNRYDAYIVFSKKIYNYLKKKKECVLFLPFGVDIEEYHPVEYEKKFDFDVAYVGNDIKGFERTKKYIYPALKFNFGLFGNWQSQTNSLCSKFKKIKSLNFDFIDFIFFLRDIKFWKTTEENGLKKQLAEVSRGKISQENMIKLLSSSKILLNCTLKGAVKYDVVNYRILEALACKGFVITDEVDILKKEFKEFVVFTKGGKDLQKKIQYYLNNEEKRKSIAEKGYKYVTENCTNAKRTEELFNFLNCLENINRKKKEYKNVYFKIKKLKSVDNMTYDIKMMFLQFLPKYRFRLRNSCMRNIFLQSAMEKIFFACRWSQIGHEEFFKIIKTHSEKMKNDFAKAKSCEEFYANWKKEETLMNIWSQITLYYDVANFVYDKFSQRNFKYLDFGCGSALISLFLSQNGYFSKVDLVDVENATSDFVQSYISSKNLGKKVKWHNVANFKSENKYDLILCNDVMEHLENPTFVLKKLHSILKQDGFLVLRAPFEHKHPEHLKEAAENFYYEGGYDFLKKNFSLYHRFNKNVHISGVYKKK